VSTQTLDHETTAVIALPAKPKSAWRQRRLGVALLMVGALVIGGVIANTVITAQFTPAAAVSDYLQAVKDGDGDAAWRQVEVVSAAQSDVSLTDGAAMRSALASARPDIRSFAVTSTAYLDSAQTQAAVGVSYDTAAGTKEATFSVIRAAQNQYGIYPTWRIELTATKLSISGLGPVSIDGKELALAPGVTASVSVLPLAHRIVFAATDMLQQQVTRIDAFALAAATVTYRPILTAAGLQHAKAAVASAFATCAQRPDQSPDGCPENVDEPFAGAGRWSLVGDPTTDLSIGQEQSQLVARGHFQMVFGYQDSSLDGTQHDISAGGYKAVLVLAPSDIAVASLSADNSLPALQRPAAATDQAVLALVSTALRACAGKTGYVAADCPQGLLLAYADNVRWQLNGDPTKAATVSFDTSTGIISVHGHLDMTAAYTVDGYPSSAPSAYTTYDALLLWDGQQLQLITIDGAFS
jgi:hypothetical protein